MVFSFIRAALQGASFHIAFTWRRYLLITVAAALVAWVSFVLLISAPRTFPTHALIVIESGQSLATVAYELEAKGVIRSPLMFWLYMRLTGGERTLNAGAYYFPEPLSALAVADRVRFGETGIESIKVTLPEGLSVREMGEALSAALPSFDEARFVALGKEYEGYLFPDTYFILPGTSPEEVIELMRQTFLSRTENLVLEENLTLEEVVTMASILEREANNEEDMRIVAGILWKRIESEMPLQVDAVFGYIKGKSGYAPSGTDLDIDSPYNTYRNKGLPPGPIGNPGMTALTAALTPTESPYLYYLTGRDGRMYWARTFEEHKENRRLYLD